jgi:hypothetical protein
MEPLGEIKIDCFVGLTNFYSDLDRYMDESICVAFDGEDYKIHYEKQIDKSDHSFNIVYNVKSNVQYDSCVKTIDIVTIMCNTTNIQTHQRGLDGYSVSVQVCMTNTEPLTLNPEIALPSEIHRNLRYLRADYDELNEDAFDAESCELARDYADGKC